LTRIDVHKVHRNDVHPALLQDPALMYGSSAAAQWYQFFYIKVQVI
jgi:hypothetical protein